MRDQKEIEKFSESVLRKISSLLLGPAQASSSSSAGPTSDSDNAEGGLCKNETPLENGIQETAANSSISDPSTAAASSSSSPPPPEPDADLAPGDAIADIRFGLSSVIGARRAMEDTATAVVRFLSVRGETYDFYGVYDGHGGVQVAAVCMERMHVVVAEEAALAAAAEGKGSEVEWWRRVMERSFERVDAEVEGVSSKVGSTAVVAVVGSRLIVLANCGDSRAVLSRAGETIAVSIDHKPDREDERKRVDLAGGWMVYWHGLRIMGILATSRSIGDYDLKPSVIPTPDVTVIERNGKEEFLILASDGLWDVVSNKLACKVARRCLTGRTARMFPEVVQRLTAQVAAGLLSELALSKRSTDNVTVILVQLRKFLGNYNSPTKNGECPFCLLFRCTCSLA